MIEIFLSILNMSITSSYVILAILLVRLLMRKLPKKFSYMLWSVAAFRLCIPVSFSSIISFFNIKLFDMSKAQESEPQKLTYVPSDIATNITPEVSVGISTLNSAINEVIPDGTDVVVVDGVMKTRAPLEIAMNIAAVVWCVGVAALLLYGAITFARVRLAMRTAVRVEGNIYASDTISSPFVLGFFKPRIYVPFGLEKEAFGYVIAHERYHIKRLDHIVKPIAFLILCAHWFNPLCWVSFLLMSRDMEMSCDEKVLSGEDGIGKAYSTTLLSFASGKRFPAPSPLAFGESGVKSRIKNALKFKKPHIWVSIIAVVLCVVTVVACAANPLENKDDITGTYEFDGYIYSFDAAGDALKNTLDFTGDFVIHKYGENITLWRYGFQYATLLDGTCTSSLMSPWLISEFESFSLTRANFDNLFGEYNKKGYWKSGFSAQKIRHRNVAAWRYTYLNDLGEEDFYYILLQRDGSVYLVCGKMASSSQKGYYIKIASLNANTLDSDKTDQVMKAIERDEAYFFPFSEGDASIFDTIETTFKCTEYIYYNGLSRSASSGFGTYRIGRDEMNYLTLYQVNMNGETKCATLQKRDIDERKLSVFDRDFTWKQGYSLKKIISENKEAYVDAFNEKYYVLLQKDGTMLLAVSKNNGQYAEIFALSSVGNDGEISLEGRNENIAIWEYSPYLSSKLPWFPISFDFEYTKIEVKTSRGNVSVDGVRYGTELVLESGEVLGWHPSPNTVKIEEYVVYSNTVLNFTAYDGNEIIYKGKIVIAPTDMESTIGKIYGAYVEGCDELTMTQGDLYIGYGGVVKVKSELPDVSPSYIKGVCTKDGVSEFFAAAKNFSGAGKEENCYNVTPLEVAASTDIEIFKFSDTGAAFALIDGGIYPICNYFGGIGFINAIPCDFDVDGNYDLLVSSNWGSGILRSEISVFNTKTKETTVLYSTLESDDPIAHLAVFPVGMLNSKPISSLSDIADVYTVEIILNNGNFADMLYVSKEFLGTVKWENGNVLLVKGE